MNCPYCRSGENKVIDKRDNDDTNVIRRRRECQNCEKRFTTYERQENINLKVKKRSGKIQPFDREKLMRSVQVAIQKRPITEEQIGELVDDIELKLLNRKATQIQTTDIGKMVLTRLKKIDKLAYILFSTVYNEFDNIDDIEKEIESLKDDR